ncbi:MAG: short-chain dehydrogenase, partial [Solirubrobacterales bacterium]|nr:short-chain dehydrogenase [Solirubrobacterales bacterium]
MAQDHGAADATGIDPAELEVCLRVLAAAELLAAEHPDAVAIRRATGRIFKMLKRARRVERRDAISAADRAVVAATATGSVQRVDDGTAGISLVATVSGALAGRFVRPRPCYICKQDYTDVDAFYHQLCPACATINRGHRDARTNLTGRRALLTGGRAKIGMY